MNCLDYTYRLDVHVVHRNAIYFRYKYNLFSPEIREEEQCERCTVVEKTQDGGEVVFHQIGHQRHLCQEFIVASSGFCFKKWLLLTALFNGCGLVLELHMQVSWN